jgi:Ran-interacting Mog1 protein
LIFDILERVDAPDSAAAEFHFDALAADNEVDDDDDDDSRVFSTRLVPTAEHPRLDVPTWALVGYQRVVKGHYRAGLGGSGDVPGEYVVIFLVVFRLAGKGTDVVVSMNYPVRNEEEVRGIHEDDTGKVLAWIDGAPGLKDAEGVLKEIVRNFEIVDWSLFDEDEEEEE